MEKDHIEIWSKRQVQGGTPVRSHHYQGPWGPTYELDGWLRRVVTGVGARQVEARVEA